MHNIYINSVEILRQVYVSASPKYDNYEILIEIIFLKNLMDNLYRTLPTKSYFSKARLRYPRQIIKKRIEIIKII